MRKISYLMMIAITGCVVILAGCSKTGPAGPSGSTGAAGPALTGNLKGHIFQYDQYGGVIATGLAGIHDSINPTHVAMTDSTGYYAFLGLGTGDYNFTVSKAGYGTNMVQGLQLIGGGDIYRDIKIAKIPNFNVTAVTATSNTTTGNIDFVGTVTTDTRARSAILYLGNSSAVSAVPVTFSNSYTGTIKANVTTFTISVNVNDIHDLGINTGSTLYCALYGASTTFASASSYEDYATGHTVYTAISTTPAANSIVMP
jgi:hypothetical protein